MGAIGYKGDIYPNGSSTAKDSVFDNTGTDLESTNAEDAIKEVDGKVEELSSNNTPENITVSNLILTDSTFQRTRFVKLGNIVWFTIAGTNSSAISNGAKVCDIPSSYAPQKRVMFPLVVNDGSSGCIDIQTDGTLKINNNSSSSGFLANKWLYASGMWIIGK